ncbi:surface-adhesin E family protein [Humidesulfovibrio mexicanus]|nr:surface-adhesin E family protein [Humidesulfovibrio mexicanus]
MKKIILSSFVVLGFAASAYAADWVHIGTTQEGSKVLVDKETIVRNGELVTFFERTDYSLKASERIKKNNKLDELPIISKSEMALNCKTKSIQQQRSLFYNADGVVIRTEPGVTMQTVVPGTIGEDEYKHLCVPKIK